MSKLAKALTAAAGNAGESLYVEDVFSTYLYTGGLSSPNVIQTNIDLAGEGGLVWTKNRTSATSNQLTDTVSGYRIESDDTAAGEASQSNVLFNSDGHSLSGYSSFFNGGGDNYASWTFRKAEKFFDVVTWTGDGTGARTISHSLNGTVGALFMKATNADMQWFSYHNGLTNAQFLELNATTQAISNIGAWNNTTPTSSEFTVGSYGNISGRTYIAYLFASDAGGFGGDGSESIIKCGSYTGTGGTVEVDLGFEPQWVLTKKSSSAGAVPDWHIYDSMRGIVTGGIDQYLRPNLADAEVSAVDNMALTATGFKVNSNISISGETYIYIAIRRPMKTPESGTEVFKANYVDNGASFPDMLSGFPVDMYFRRYVNTTNSPYWFTRLLGTSLLNSASTGAEQTVSANSAAMDSNVGVMNIFSTNNTDFYGWMFKRATGFFDVVAYTGTGVAHNEEHNLGVVPEMLIIKPRNLAANWTVWHKDLVEVTEAPHLRLNSNLQKLENDSYYDQSSISSTVFNVGISNVTNGSSYNYIAYLFASLAGVSKVGSYTGTGADLNVDCGFSAGARFILIKRTDSTGDWYVWDSVRGIVAGNDPYLLLNSTAAEVTSTDYIDPLASGFTVTSSAPAALNASGGNYIFLAIA